MQKLNDLSRSLTPLKPDGTLIAVIEMSLSSWLVAGIVPGVERQPSKKLEVDENALLKLLNRWREEAHKAGQGIERIAVAFEAGRFLAGPLAQGARHRGACHSRIEHSGIARAPARQDRSSRHRTARLSRLVAGRARSLQDGRDPDNQGRRCQALHP
jgi:hypothetical protein